MSCRAPCSSASICSGNGGKGSPIVSPEYLERQASGSNLGLAERALNPFRGVGRNDPCPCGSGKKFKRCCLQ